MNLSRKANLLLNDYDECKILCLTLSVFCNICFVRFKKKIVSYPFIRNRVPKYLFEPNIEKTANPITGKLLLKVDLVAANYAK